MQAPSASMVFFYSLASADALHTCTAHRKLITASTLLHTTSESGMFRTAAIKGNADQHAISCAISQCGSYPCERNTTLEPTSLSVS